MCRGWRAKTLDATWAVSEGPEGMQAALTRLCHEAMQAIQEGYSFLILSDRATGEPLHCTPMCCQACCCSVLSASDVGGAFASNVRPGAYALGSSRGARCSIPKRSREQIRDWEC